MKKQSLIFLIVGSLCCLGAAVLLICCIINGGNFLHYGSLVLTLLGGGVIIWMALRQNKLYRQAAAAPVEKKSRPDAPSPLAGKASGLTARMVALLILTLSCVAFFFLYGEALQAPSIPQSTVQTGIVYERGKVIAIDESTYQGQQDVEYVPVGKQIVQVELTDGEHKGNVYTLTNNLSYLYGTVLSVGDPVTVTFSMTNGEIENILLADYDRTVPAFVILGLFLLVTVLVGGKVGAKSLLGLAFTILCVFALLIPMLLGGAPTLSAILLLCTYVTIVEFVILDGVNKKTVCAILGTMSGVIFAMLFGQLACAVCRVDGFKMYVAEPHIEALLQIKQGQDPFASLQIGDLLVGGILIAALGAVNDVAMSISSAMNELVAVNPELTRRQLLRSGMNIGRDMVGTMTNTLILALVGNGLVLMIYLCSLEPSFKQLMSTAFLSVEMVQALASSIGVILAVPMSVLIGMLLFGRKKAAKKTV